MIKSNWAFGWWGKLKIPILIQFTQTLSRPCESPFGIRRSQAQLAQRAIRLKLEDYVRPIREHADKTLRESLTPDLIAINAEEVRINLIRRFSFRTMAWAMLARQSGACLLAKEAISEQLATLNAAIGLVPEEAREVLNSRLTSDKGIRQAFLSQTHCDLDAEIRSQARNLERLKGHLSSLCQNTTPDVDSIISALTTDISAFLVESPKQNSNENISLMHMIGSELWSRGYYLATTCNRGTR
jgi:hypothetical protein